MACNNGHVCQQRCCKPCGKCTYRIEKVIPMCGHKARVECHRDPGTWYCTSRCNQPLEKCGHQCSGKCGECRKSGRHADQCTEEVERTWPCGHLMKVPCSATPATRPCVQPCKAKLECGHVCQGTRGECWEGRVHKDCGRPCNKLLLGCGHWDVVTCVLCHAEANVCLAKKRLAKRDASTATALLSAARRANHAKNDVRGNANT
ncbi:NFX1-type zinc finger-containing protein 1-like [Pomacea canaliculata]|uniref:NFX1-type zinc finger-containing protein 1-like n=1 Tax=Pomacea canaliculata TaxID=400727 RepID=UPI000D72E806|nr:NFX1-type zinc finger-containing protein 1-like [Pomacea canaliculata]